MSDPTEGKHTMPTTPTGPMVTYEMVEAAYDVWSRRLEQKGKPPLPSTLLVRGMLESALAAMPAAEPTAPEGPSTYEQSWMDGYCEGHEDGWQRGLRSAPPTTPAPDGLAERVDYLWKVGQEDGYAIGHAWIAIEEMQKSIDAHDATLSELRDGLDAWAGRVQRMERTTPPGPSPIVTDVMGRTVFQKAALAFEAWRRRDDAALDGYMHEIGVVMTYRDPNREPAAGPTTPEVNTAIAHDEAMQAYHTDLVAVQDDLNMHGIAIGELVERVEQLEAFTGVATMNDLEGSYRVHMERDHAPRDAALVELREDLDDHQHTAEDIMNGASRTGGPLVRPTPPDVPDAAEDDDEGDSVRSRQALIEAVTRLEYFDSCAMQDAAYERLVIAEAEAGDAQEDVTKDRAYWFGQGYDKGYKKGRRLTPAPPPLVVSDELVKVAVDSWRRTLSDGFTGKYVIMGYALDAAAQHWNATRVPAGDDGEKEST